MCITTTDRPDTISCTNPDYKPDHINYQTTCSSKYLTNVYVTCPTHREKYTRDNVIAPFLLHSIVIVKLLCAPTLSRAGWLVGWHRQWSDRLGSVANANLIVVTCFAAQFSLLATIELQNLLTLEDTVCNPGKPLYTVCTISDGQTVSIRSNSNFESQSYWLLHSERVAGHF